MSTSILEFAFNDILGWVLRFVILLTFGYVVYEGDYLFAITSLFAIFLSCTPMMLNRSFKISLPWELNFLITFSLFLHVTLGEVMEFYDLYPFWDKFMHLLGTAIIGILGFMAVYSFHYARKIRLSLPLICLFTVIFSMAVGSAWEIGEFTIDKIFGRNTQYSLDNTMIDLINNTIAGLVVGISGIFYVKYVEGHSRKRLHRTVRATLGTFNQRFCNYTLRERGKVCRFNQDFRFPQRQPAKTNSN
jgi:hypothetical protein